MRVKFLPALATLCSMVAVFASLPVWVCAYGQMPAATPPKTQVTSGPQIRIANQAGETIGFLLGTGTIELRPGQVSNTPCEPGTSQSIQIRTGDKSPFLRPLLCGDNYEI